MSAILNSHARMFVFLFLLTVLSVWSIVWAGVMLIVHWQFVFWFMVIYGTYRLVIRRKH